MTTLTREQEEAANFLEGICAVIAVPGSGKTLTMTERIGILVKKTRGFSREHPWIDLYEKRGAGHEGQIGPGS